MKKKQTNSLSPFPEAETPEGKMTIYDYEHKYVKRQNVRGAKFFLRFLVVVIGLFLLAMLVFVTLRLYEVFNKNQYVAYISGGVCLLLYIFLYVVPLIKIFRLPYFVTNVNAYGAGKAKRHNKKVRRDIAKKIIDLTSKVEGVGWYDSQVVGRLAIALQTNDDEKLKTELTALYKGSVKKSAKDLIFKSSLRAAAYSAISQAAKVDAALVVFVNLQLVKDLVFLYGFRPSDARLAKIFAAVLRNSLIAYGLGGLNIGRSVVQTMGSAVKGIPLLGSAISALVDSSVQGLTNGTLTTVIGYQTIRYLTTEYRLQNILDGIEVAETQEEMEAACTNLEKQLKKKEKKKLATAV